MDGGGGYIACRPKGLQFALGYFVKAAIQGRQPRARVHIPVSAALDALAYDTLAF